MGNTNEAINGHKYQNNKKINVNNFNSDDEKDFEKNNQISEYDKELSHILFDEGYDNEKENKKKKKKKKKTLKEELDNYAEQIEEEKFMEEINRSKSIQKQLDDINDDEDDEDNYAAFKRWKAENKKKKKKKENKEEKKTNMKIINNNDDDNDNDNDNDNLNINNEINKNNKNKKTKKNKIIEEKRRVNSSDKLNKFKNNIKEKNENIKSNNKHNNKEDDTITLTNEKVQFLKQAMKNYVAQNQQKTNNFKNDIQNLEKNVNNKENKNLKKANRLNPTILKSKTYVQPKIDKGMNKAQSSEENKQSIFNYNKNYKVKKEKIKIVTLYLRNGNIKYEAGLQFCGLRKYDNALVCFAQARNSYMQLNKLLNNNTKDYPEEFRKLIIVKLFEKIKLVNQSIRECNQLIKKGKNIKKTTNEKEILKKINFKEDNNINLNYSHIDDSFDFNSPEPEQNPNPKFQNKNNQKQGKNILQDEDSAMDAKIESEIMSTNPGVKFSDIIGMQEMKKILYEIIIVPTIRPDFFTGIRKPQRGILLFGPPGTGKTMIAKAIASECKSTFFNISASSLTSKWVGESEKTVKSLFKIAYKKAPSIIFIDEIDSILSKRNENENEATKRLKTEFLIQFDGLGSDNNAKLLVIAATNRPMDLDEALLRRLPKRVYCGPLDVNGRFEFIKKVINRVETNLNDKDIMEIAKMTNGYSNSDLKELCKEAAFQPVRELTMEQILKIKKFRPLVKNDLVLAVNKIRGSLSNKVIGELLKWNEQFGGV